MTEQVRQLVAFGAALFTPRTATTVTAWAEANVYLPSEVAQDSGLYSTRKCRYIVDFLEDFANPEVSESSNCFAAQTFKTTGLYVGLGYRIVNKPASGLLTYPSQPLALSYSQTKFQPMVEASPALVAKKPRKADDYKNLQMGFEGGTLHWIGSGSEANLKGKSVALLVVDEIDDVEKRWAKKKRSGISMLESRVRSYAGSQIFKSGTPSEVTGAIWLSFLAGDQRLFFVECPECKGAPFIIELDPEYIREWFPKVNAGKIVWDKSAKNADGTWDTEKVKATAALECPYCKWHIAQHRLPAMIYSGKWIAQNPKAPSGKVSRRLPAMYSPHEKCTLGQIAADFLQCQNVPGGLHNFINETLALPFAPKGSAVKASDIAAVIAHSPSYVRGEIPRDNIALLCLTVDVNADAMRWVLEPPFLVQKECEVRG